MAVLLFVAPLVAPHRAGAADDLPAWLDQLRVAPPDQSAQIAQTIERHWSQSGSAALDLLLRRGRDAHQAGNHRLAIEHLTALIDHAPDFAEGWHARAQAFFAAGRLGPALGDLQQTLALNPDHFNALYGLGLIFETLNDPIRARRAYEQVLGLHPHHPKAKTALKGLQDRGLGQSL